MVLPLIAGGLALGGGALQALGARKAQRDTQGVLDLMRQSDERFGRTQQAVNQQAIADFRNQSDQRRALLDTFLGTLQGQERTGAGEQAAQDFQGQTQGTMANLLALEPNLQATGAFGQRAEQDANVRLNPLAELLAVNAAGRGRQAVEQQAAGAMGEGSQRLTRGTQDLAFNQQLGQNEMDRNRAAELFGLQQKLAQAGQAGGGQRLLGGLMQMGSRAMMGGFGG